MKNAYSKMRRFLLDFLWDLHKDLQKDLEGTVWGLLFGIGLNISFLMPGFLIEPSNASIVSFAIISYIFKWFWMVFKKSYAEEHGGYSGAEIMFAIYQIIIFICKWIAIYAALNGFILFFRLYIS